MKREFLTYISRYITIGSDYNLSQEEIAHNFLIVWEMANNKVRIHVTENQEICNLLNQNAQLFEKTKFYLKKVFRYVEGFGYETDNLPF